MPRSGNIKMVKRERAKVIRYVRYSPKKEEAHFFREQCLLFLPWRNEQNDIEDKNSKQLYEENREMIERNQKKYVTIPEDQIDKLFEEAQQDDEDSDDEDELLLHYIQEQDDQVDILAQGGQVKSKPKDTTSKRYFCPEKVPQKDLLEILQTLNPEQRTFVMHILKCIKTGNYIPFHIFLSGAAGVGKSTVINATYQLATHHFDNVRGENPDTVKVLLTAFSGKAACIINGTTLHSAFALPVNQRKK